MPHIDWYSYRSNKIYRYRICDSVLYLSHNFPYRRNHRYHDKISQVLHSNRLENYQSTDIYKNSNIFLVRCYLQFNFSICCTWFETDWFSVIPITLPITPPSTITAWTFCTSRSRMTSTADSINRRVYKMQRWYSIPCIISVNVIDRYLISALSLIFVHQSFRNIWISFWNTKEGRRH